MIENYMNNLTWEEIFNKLGPAITKHDEGLPEEEKWLRTDKYEAEGATDYYSLMDWESDDNLYITMSEQYGVPYSEIKDGVGTATLFDSSDAKQFVKDLSNEIKGIEFEFSSSLAFSLLFAINAVQAIGDMSATTIGGMNREPTGNELRGGIISFGLSNMLSALFGGLPNATYSQNVGIVSSTKVVNRKTLALTALMLLIAGLVPKFSAILTTIPQCVLGGATVSVFASIAMTGMKLVAMQPMSYRNTSIVGLSAALGMGVSMVSESLAQFPEWVTLVFASSPVVISAIVAIVLNLILPKEEKKEGNS